MNKQYIGPKSLDIIKAQCAAQNLICEDGRYQEGESDFIAVYSPASPEAKVMFNAASGSFYGTTHEGHKFDSMDMTQTAPWFLGLLDFFYVAAPGQEEAAPAAAAAIPAHEEPAP